MKYEFELSRENERYMIELIKRYFSEEREEDIGDLAASLMLNFIVKEFAPEFYNIGIYDAHKYMSERAEEMLELQK